MAFQVPASQQSIGQDEFTFGPKSGAEYGVKKAKYLTLTQLEKLEGSAPAIAFFAGTDDPDREEFIRGLELEQFQALTTAWRADSGLTAGE